VYYYVLEDRYMYKLYTVYSVMSTVVLLLDTMGHMDVTGNLGTTTNIRYSYI